ncbi:YebC/PmpR family DNA-binding transcriptional regulator [Ureaplasma canigenitalium]|uniref:YebC/PmpR family DNA-binding transcriptional regulator n=1 Tax=Ureaplasma canigenitalium TaxID=42092 RepID=UPI0004E26FF9|nr:YebC/PmpR family DNA-binding transcriptional regulator [Ureaplasma canigenitalium]
MPRKHLIASGINKKQQNQAKIWMKCAKEIKQAAKQGTNPETNLRLKAAIARALNNNLSRDSIEKNINGATRDKDNLKELTYEGYGPNGLSVIIKVLTDNEQRTISNIRGYFSKLNGQLAKPNSVIINFNEYGQILLKNDRPNLTDIVLDLLLVEANVIDVNEQEDVVEILTEPSSFNIAREIIDKNGFSILSSEIKLIPNDFVSLDDTQKERLVRFINQTDDDDDISWVITNFEEEI